MLFSRGDGFGQPRKIALGSGGDRQGDDFGDFVAVERNGIRITHSTPGNTLGKETHILAYQEPTLKIRMHMESGATVELLYTIGGKTGPVGVIQRANGTHDTVDGSARWEGDRLIYEQGVHDTSKGTVFRLVRSLKLAKDGMSMMCTSGDKMCCDMIQACCDCMTTMLKAGCTCCMCLNGNPVCCGCC